MRAYARLPRRRLARAPRPTAATRAGARAAQAAAVRRPSARRPACAGRSGEGGGRTARPPRAARRAAPLGQTPSGGGREQRRAPRAERATPPLTTTSARAASNWATSTRRGGGGAERTRGARARACAPFGTTPARVRVAHLQARAGCLQLRDRRLLFSFWCTGTHRIHAVAAAGSSPPPRAPSTAQRVAAKSTVRSTRSRGVQKSNRHTRAHEERMSSRSGEGRALDGGARATAGFLRRVLAASCSSPPRTPAQPWKRCAVRASF